MADLDYNKWPGDPGPVQRYLEDGCEPGSFLEALLSNDLKYTCAKADDFNRTLIWHYVHWLWNHAPAQAWGSPERYREWIKQGGLKGMGYDVERPLVEQAPSAT